MAAADDMALILKLNILLMPAFLELTSPFIQLCTTPPCCADLQGFLALERGRPPCGDPQHIFNKLLWDATNEALVLHRTQVCKGCR